MGNANRLNYCWVAFIMALILSISWFFVGVEQVSGEFKEDTEYVFFIKKHMSAKIFFVDPTNCNAGCDTPLLSNLNEEKIKQFSDYCFYRYDLSSEENCYNMLYRIND
ncbi:hypothetical protein [Erwinia sp. S38]|uniref:hypothetical protein n=1 Tax=Erwinia sp. S38 TaxID=2769338 RepID=UPI00190A88EC|nr:hypothetical protein [Erwinia sp. S38]MBK0004466.1 hypothetical protein [Erwinia sp. S38]